MNPVIVCVATEPRFQKNMERLKASLVEHWPYDSILFTDWPKPVGIESYTQSEMPYQFKVAAIQQAIEAGYSQIIWLDSVMQLLKNPLPLLEKSESGLVFFHNLGHPLKNYISDDAVDLINKSRQPCHSFGFKDLDNYEQVWGGAFMMNIIKFPAIAFWEDLKSYSINGAFKNGGSSRPGFVAHRHDQAIMSVLSKDYGATLLPYGYIISKEHLATAEYGKDNYILYS